MVYEDLPIKIGDFPYVKSPDGIRARGFGSRSFLCPISPIQVADGRDYQHSKIQWGIESWWIPKGLY